MKIKIKILSGGVKKQTMEVMADSTYEQMLESININPETVIVFCNGVPVPLDEKVAPDGVEILRIVTGG